MRWWQCYFCSARNFFFHFYCIWFRKLTSNDNWVTLTETLQRNATAFAKLFNFNFLNYFHLNAYWIYVLGTTALPLIERLLKCGKRIEKKANTQSNRRRWRLEMRTTRRWVRRLKKFFVTLSPISSRHHFAMVWSDFLVLCLQNVCGHVSARAFAHILSLSFAYINDNQPTYQRQTISVLLFFFSFHFICHYCDFN